MLHHINPVSGLLAAALFLSAPVQAALPAYSAVKDEASGRVSFTTTWS